MYRFTHGGNKVTIIKSQTATVIKIFTKYFNSFMTVVICSKFVFY